jgi:hypothetical protein
MSRGGRRTNEKYIASRAPVIWGVEAHYQRVSSPAFFSFRLLFLLLPFCPAFQLLASRRCGEPYLARRPYPGVLTHQVELHSP